MTDRSLIERIRKLKQLTTARGCSEAEAMAAAAKVAALMKQAGLTDAMVDAEQCGSYSMTGGRSVRRAVWTAIAHYTNTALITVRCTGEKGCIPTFVGYGGGPEVADYLRVVCDRAIERETRQFKAGTFYRRRRSRKTRRVAVHEFTIGLCSRIIDKLADLFADQVSEDMRRSAVALRDDLYTDTHTVSIAARADRYSEAVAAGAAAGGRVRLSHGVNGEQAPKQISGGAS